MGPSDLSNHTGGALSARIAGMNSHPTFRAAWAALAVLVAPLACVPAARAASVGVYDSRLVAYAWFNAPPQRTALRARVAAARKAQADGDREEGARLERLIKADQSRIHLQVFSTAPIPEILEQLAPAVTRARSDTGVTRLVSKWDTAALRGIPPEERIDVTELLVRDLELDEKQRATLRAIAAKPPLPLWQARLLAFAGRL